MTTVAVRRIHVLAIALLLGLGLVFQGALPARGCSCMAPDPYAGLVEADGAFVGALVSVDRDLGPVYDSSTLVDFQFEVEAALKGDIGETIVVKSAVEGASCGFEVPVGQRVGILLHRIGGEWQGTLCSTLDADALLAAVEGPPTPVAGSPPHVVASVSMGEAGLVALNRAGEIVGYGRGQPPGLLSVCPDGQVLIGHAGGNQVRTWSLASLEEVGHVEIGPDDFYGFHNLICSGDEEFFVLAGDGTGNNPEMSLSHYVSGAGEVVSEDMTSIVPTKTGLLAIGADGVVHRLDTRSGDLEALTEPLGDIRGQTAAIALSPDEKHLAVATVDWTRAPIVGRMAVADLTGGIWAEMSVDCDVYPAWLDDRQITFQESCVSEQYQVYTPDLDLIGPGENTWPVGYANTAVDETGTRFLSAQYGVDILEAGSESSVPWARLPTYPNQLIIVPEGVREMWTGSDFIPSPPEVSTASFLEPAPDDVVPIEAESDPVSPWVIGLGSAVVAGVFWLLLRRS
ncbi:MAG TPA: hypothetical protein VNT92_02550 [Acidimicrobiia bacterium]|nr:hypothetical protein [Acidimicrobiia bacterium]